MCQVAGPADRKREQPSTADTSRKIARMLVRWGIGWSPSSGTQDGNTFDLHLCGVVEQAFNFNQDHCRIVFTEVLLITLSYFLPSLAVLILISDVDNQSGHISRSPASFAQHRGDVSQGLVKLRYEVTTNNLLRLIPGDLAGDEE